jgi:HSP20 family protein
MKSQRASPQNLGAAGAKLRPYDPERLRGEAQEVQLAIARGAYELFESRGREHGHDWEDWFRAESEVLRPVPITIAESADQVEVWANVLGFEESELKVSIEPHGIVILGKKEATATETEGGKIEYIDWSPDRILRFVALPAEVDPKAASVELREGLLSFELLKASSRRVSARRKAA